MVYKSVLITSILITCTVYIYVGIRHPGVDVDERRNRNICIVYVIAFQTALSGIQSIAAVQIYNCSKSHCQIAT